MYICIYIYIYIYKIVVIKRVAYNVYELTFHAGRNPEGHYLWKVPFLEAV